MIRVAWWVALVALALVAMGAQLDRASALDPALAPFVPTPFRSSAQVVHTAMAMAAQDPKVARSEATKLVRRRPVPAEHLYLLATAQLRAGDTEGFERTFRLATERGWRVEPIQVIAARAALSQGDPAAAANRIAALWAIGGDAVEVRALTRALLSTPGGPEAFGRKLAAGSRWREQFLAEASSMGSRGAIERTLRAAGECTAAPCCDESCLLPME